MQWQLSSPRKLDVMGFWSLRLDQRQKLRLTRR